ncbi:leucine-rich repeat domain-containing protein [uncultured Aurantimicrobium sp.]|uniref:leucine-rich repeat domain-containing protein n=1 Tax=uncultured Aurantimicrobium sp. TaxID=1705357 RepID=UPI00261FDAD8|nr:leucine-rich repeat domain-containing protein [uncultured Aurantimicrobium sp.]
MRKNSVVTVIISALLLLALISTPAHAIGATSTENCSISGTFTITSGVVSGGNSCAGVAVIPASVTSIGNSAFAGATALSSITIPSSVTSIPEGAFYGATALTSITIPASVTSIGDLAFQDATSLASVYFLGNAPATIGITPFLNTAPGAKALIRSGTTGFTTSGTPALWNGLAVEVVADTPMPAQTPQLAETGASEPIALGVMASMSATLVASGMFLLHRRRKLG